ncbi:hypothetical protein ACGFZ9_34425 [Streptomyces mirabilis]|uniref:hypothetical protein n=1 Tax=Streptomyces mirabilis TaxID=68239 RepID=UPI003715BDC0
MPDLAFALTVDSGASSPLYKVRVNDGGPDGGSTSELFIGGSRSSLSSSDVDNAVQAFASTLGAVPGFTVLSITRFAAGETPL